MPEQAIDIQHTTAQLVQFFETLSPQTLHQLHTLYASNARFKDPFNDVQGSGAIEKIFQHMFETLLEPRFVVSKTIVQDKQCFLVWDFHFRFRQTNRSVQQTINGSSYLEFDSDGRVLLHRDYWDAAQELYEKLPILGGIMRWLRRRVGSA